MYSLTNKINVQESMKVHTVKKNTIIIYILINKVHIYILTISLLSPTETGDYCLTESFQGSCSEDEVIMMDEALYGRMSLGRCVKTDFGFVGCSTDVLGLADTRCSGRRRCVIRVPDPLFEDTRPCNEEFKSYLKASYSCVRGE